jgi:hypothetical protein
VIFSIEIDDGLALRPANRAPPVSCCPRSTVLSLDATGRESVAKSRENRQGDRDALECVVVRDDKAMEASEETFRRIVETIPGLIAVMTPRGEVEHVNSQVLE